MKIICDDKIPFLKGVLEPYARVVYLPGQEISAEVVKGADAMIIRTRTICDRALLEGSSVKIVATATIGYDHIDTAWCDSHGIVWKNAPGCNSSSVQQYIASVLCVLAERFNLHFKDLTLGVVGVGHVGSKVAEAARALGMKVLLCDPPRAREEGPEGFVDLNEIVSSTDIITLHVPLSHDGPDATWHMFDSERIASLRPDQILINSSRGPVVDNPALKNALKAGRIKAAVLDVWENEPDIDLELLNLLTIATPHIAGYSADGKANGTAASVQAVAAYLGLPLTDWAPSAMSFPARFQESAESGCKPIISPRESVEPGSQHMVFSLDATGKTVQGVLSEAILNTYDVREDDEELRLNPELFEKLRGNYPVRRDFGAFVVRLLNGSLKAEESLTGLGFNLEEC